MKKGSQRLGAHHRLRIVSELAAFATPSEVAQTILREFGIKISPQRIEAYDPTKKAGQRLSSHWWSMFFKIREQSLAKIAEIPECHRVVRVKYLADGANSCAARGDFTMIARLLEQIAKEIGGLYEQRIAWRAIRRDLRDPDRR